MGWTEEQNPTQLMWCYFPVFFSFLPQEHTNSTLSVQRGICSDVMNVALCPEQVNFVTRCEIWHPSLGKVFTEVNESFARIRSALSGLLFPPGFCLHSRMTKILHAFLIAIFYSLVLAGLASCPWPTGSYTGMCSGKIISDSTGKFAWLGSTGINT